MSDLSKYERLGDIEAPFDESTKKHHRVQKESFRIVDSMRCEVPSLSYEDYRSGVPCPGCGRPYIDKESWDFRGTMHMTAAERARYEAEEFSYNARHVDCHSSRHSVSGSLTTHCMKCCPPPPLSPTQIERLSTLLGRTTPPHELMIWRLRLYCGHVVEKQAHRSHTTVHGAFTGQVSCPECGLDPATIVDAVAVGLVQAPPTETVSPRRTRSRPTHAQLERRVEQLGTGVRRLQQS